MLLLTRDDLVGECELCGARLVFTILDDGDRAYYNGSEVVNKWMEHQLNDCNPDIDNG